MQELRDIRAAVDAGKKELAALRESEREVSVLKSQLEDLCLEKEGLENLIADQRHAWEEEKTKQDLEDREREENLKTLRQTEEEKYRLMRENEQIQARQKLEEELEVMRQKSGEIWTQMKRIFSQESRRSKKRNRS